MSKTNLTLQQKLLTIQPRKCFEFERASREYKGAQLAFFLYRALTIQKITAMNDNGGIPINKLIGDNSLLPSISNDLLQNCIKILPLGLILHNNALYCKFGHLFKVPFSFYFRPHSPNDEKVYYIRCCNEDYKRFRRKGFVPLRSEQQHIQFSVCDTMPNFKHGRCLVLKQPMKGIEMFQSKFEQSPKYVFAQKKVALDFFVMK